ncbi:hypothetical protein MesoLjLc_42750 [Mesorhizobium sp. L-8-10]|uniref:ABC transporter substrate-binding protein n=1 Tax=Mesorhizobium sp. L-8-10 TaxID=2744523 RepID=UPI001925E93C|nr:ABC transporter substrate-binding protein [Mesorhizobium sp. L-8-10]BCH32345.1 hypothetical protein MesoLjLc_42750 [Mesorhizobium sp. L-8-10]
MTETFQLSRRHMLQLGAAAGVMAGSSTLGVTRLLAAGSEKVKIIHASPATLLVWSISYLAEDMGYYKEEGLAVERLGLGGGPAAMTALLAGEGTMNVSAPGECLAANARGQRIKIIQAYTRSDPYTISVTKAFADANGITAASPREQREKALTAMKGKRIGITAPGSNTDLVVRMALQQVGLDPTSDVTIVPAGSIVNIMSALSQGGLDGGALLAPFTEQAGVEFEAVPLLAIAAGEIPQAGRLQGQVLEARPEDLEAKRDLFAAFIRADLRALKFLQEDPDGARAKLRQTRFPKIADAIWPDVWASALPIFASPYVARDSIQAWLETGTIGGNPDPNTFPYDEIIDMSLVDEGLQKLGWSPKS